VLATFTDDGYLRAEHKNYYVACGGQAFEAAAHRVFDPVAFGSFSGKNRDGRELWEYAWGSDKPVNTESLHVYIYRLRNKLALARSSIDTMVNVGYRLLPGKFWRQAHERLSDGASGGARVYAEFRHGSDGCNTRAYIPTWKINHF